MLSGNRKRKPLAETITSQSAGGRKVPRRLARFFEQAEAANLLTEDAVQAVLNLVDPFPDQATSAVGWPGMCAQHTVPSIITKYLPITAPIGTTTTWNYKVIFLPFSNPFVSGSIQPFDRATGKLGTPVVKPPVTYGQFNVWTWRAEDPEPDVIIDGPNYSAVIDPSSDWSLIRLTLAGFEAINTSSELYRGGMYYAFRVPLVPDDHVVVYNGTDGQSTQGTIARLRMIAGIPDQLQDVINLNTTISSDARDGVGVFSLPMDPANPFTSTLPTSILLTQPLDKGATLQARLPNVAVSSPYDWTICGAYVTGLAAQATFELKMRCGYEMRPGSDATNFMQAIARPAVPRSFIIEEMLYQMLNHMPAGFDYSENPLGEWIGKVLQGLGAFIPTAASFIPHPAAKAIGGIAGPAISSIGKALNPPSAGMKPQYVPLNKTQEISIKKKPKKSSAKSARPTSGR